jgi:addiction module RelB/DinJ family antitoxin
MKTKSLIFTFIKIMRKTEVYQIRLDSQEKKQAFAVFKQLGITPAQAVRLFFKQVVLTKSIPFSIENQNINLEQLIKLRRLKQEQKTAIATLESDDTATSTQRNDEFLMDDDHLDLFEELNAILGESDKN